MRAVSSVITSFSADSRGDRPVPTRAAIEQPDAETQLFFRVSAEVRRALQLFIGKRRFASGTLNTDRGRYILHAGEAGEDQDRCLHLGDAQRSEHLVARHIGQVQVEQNDVVVVEFAKVGALFAEIRRVLPEYARSRAPRFPMQQYRRQEGSRVAALQKPAERRHGNSLAIESARRPGKPTGAKETLLASSHRRELKVRRRGLDHLAFGV